MTTARYYTPSGRLIQRPWDGTFDEYLTYTLREQDPNKAHKRRGPEVHRRRPQGVQRRRRRAGSALRRSGGRLQPDAVRPHAATRASCSTSTRSGSAPRATRASRRAPSTRTSSWPGLRGRPTRWWPSSRRLVDEVEPIKIDEAAWQKDQDFIKAMIRHEIDRRLVRRRRGVQNLAKRDPQLQFAMTLFREAQQLLEMSRQSTTARGPRAKKTPTSNSNVQNGADWESALGSIDTAPPFGPQPKILWCHFGLATMAGPC